ncbi:TolC family protein [Pedobacter immunditicola]|uniref:TolC family protein n=1 Tax=Pedobacter immunditicola TaxID=3133440 RepID=UPI00309D5A75
MMKYILQMLLVLFILWSKPSQAQQPNTLSLQQAWERANNNYPGLEEQKYLVDEFKIRKKEVQSQALPQVQLQAQSSYGTFAGSTGAFFSLPGIFNVSGNNSINPDITAAQNTFGSALMDWRIFEFGKQRKAVEAAEFQVKVAESSYDAADLSLQSRVTKLYIDILYNKATLIWAENNVIRLNNIRNVTVSLALAGLKPGADTSLATSSFLQAKAYQHEWLGKYDASRINFTEVVPVQDFNLPGHAFLKADLGDLKIDSLPISHPYLKVITNQLSYEQTQESLLAKGAFPSLSILGGLSSRGNAIHPNGTITSGLTSGFANYANNYLIGLGISWNISGVYASSLAKKRAEKTVKSIQARYDTQKLQMRTALDAVNSRISQQEEQLMKSKLAEQQAKNAYDLYLVRYEGGLISLTELLQIQSFLQLAEREYLEAQQVLWNLLITQAEVSGDFNYLASQFN